MTFRNFKPQENKTELKAIFDEILSRKKLSDKVLRKILGKNTKSDDSFFSKDQLIAGFKYLQEIEELPKDTKLPKILTKKPTRTISGVTTVTILTKPFACPGKCIFCPNDIRMPKSYIATEPGAQRALSNRFDPYKQTYNRLKALHLIGHPTDKVELLVLGGTWSYYPKPYQIWFVKEAFRAMNDFDPKNIKDLSTPNDKKETRKQLTNDINTTLRKKLGDQPYNELIKSDEYQTKFKKFITPGIDARWEELFEEHEKNVNAKSRCVGLVLETRPDTLNPRQVLDLRKLGATKIQIGVQTLDPKVNKLNKRMETKEQISKAFQLLRAAGFKIHAHIMPNLYGADPESDLNSYRELFESLEYKPDELKIYPTSIIPNTGLSKLYEEGKYKPYKTKILIKLLGECMEQTPEYCRLTRVIRDIPSDEILAGNKLTNLRQMVEQMLEREKRDNPNIRAREIRGKDIGPRDLTLQKIKYETKYTHEVFLQYITKNRDIAGFLRLSLPKRSQNPITKELDNNAIIREIHVYGPSLNIGKDSSGQAQHIGLGTKLIEEAISIAKPEGYKDLSVISAIGTKEYYQKKGFSEGKYYQHRRL